MFNTTSKSFQHKQKHFLKIVNLESDRKVWKDNYHLVIYFPVSSFKLQTLKCCQFNTVLKEIVLHFSVLIQFSLFEAKKNKENKNKTKQNMNTEMSKT